MTAGNARAAKLAAASPFVRDVYAKTESLARSIGDGALRASVLDLLHDPRALYGRRHPSEEARLAVRDALARAGFVETHAPVAGIFPHGTEASARSAPQPFWSAPGSSYGSHHAYPGGLAVHEYFNGATAVAYTETYDRLYFSDTKTLDRDTVVGAALYHDIMKAVVFQWNDDGSLTNEATIAGTGAHHALSGAEAIVRGRSPRFVVTLLSAHAAPSLGDEAKVVAWCRAAAIVAGVDPVAYGLLERSGGTYALAIRPVPIEAFVTYLSDHDFALATHAYHEVAPKLNILMQNSYGSQTGQAAWFRNAIFAQSSAIRLYQLILAGDAAFNSAVSDAAHRAGIVA
jgi:hypothetical protein